MRFTTSPRTSDSITHARYAGCTRYIVLHGHTTGSRQNTVLSGFSFASRDTRLISVPTPMTAPGGAAATYFAMNEVEPLASAACTTS